MITIQAANGILTMLRTFQSINRAYNPKDWVDYDIPESYTTYEEAIDHMEKYIEECSGYGDNA